MQRAIAEVYGAEQSAADDQMPDVHSGPGPFHHEALFYRGERGFLEGTLPFINEALAGGEPLLIAVRDVRAQLLRGVLGHDAGRVRFVDMHLLGRNPARMIPAWSDFVKQEAVDGRRVRVLAESAWGGRSQAELSECQRYESLLNLAFRQGAQWRLLCPYDVEDLDASAIEAARLSHPFIMREGKSSPGESYLGPEEAPSPFAGALAPPATDSEELAFTGEGLAAVRNLVFGAAVEAGLSEESREDLVLAINELATNSVEHGGGGGVLAIWTEGEALWCEIRDHGRIVDPLAGRIPPPLEQHGGRGLWLVNHLCDLVQIRSTPTGNTVRVLKRR